MDVVRAGSIIVVVNAQICCPWICGAGCPLVTVSVQGARMSDVVVRVVCV